MIAVICLDCNRGKRTLGSETKKGKGENTMRNIGICKTQNLLFLLLLFVLTGCGANSTTTAGVADPGVSGKLAATFEWADGKSAAKSVAAVPVGVTTLRLRITGPYQIPGDTSSTSRYTAAKATFPAADLSGTVAVAPGTGLIVIAEALDAGDTVLYEKIVSGVSVTAGATTNLGTIVLNAPPVKVADKPCQSCHENSRDTNGNSLVSNYKTSRHYNITTSPVAKYGVNSVGCAGCHGPAHNDLNPSASGRCAECHTSALGFGPESGPGSLSASHYAIPARYLNDTKGNCTTCHQPHNQAAGKDERATWAESGHGEVAAAPWVPSSSHAWRITGSTANFQTGVPASDCLRCHTADGFAQFVSSGYTNVNNLPGDSTINSPLNCNACHNDNSYSMRPATAFTARYNAGKSPKTFPDVGTSNLCIACHSARESGDTILGITSNMNATGFKNSHYMGAAATMYMSNAFINYTTLTAPAATNNELNADGTKAAFASTKPYAKNNLPDNVSVPGYGIVGGTTSTHRRVGTPDIAGRETYLVGHPSAIATNGPCVTCHMQADNPVAGDTPENKDVPVPAFRPGHGHSLKIDQATAQQVCLPCHGEQHLDGDDGAGNPIYTATVSLATLQSAMLEPQKECFQNGLNLLKQILQTKYMIKYDPAVYPYFYDLQKAGTPAMTDWTRVNVAGVTDAAVAAFGSATLTAIPVGGYNDIQAKRLMGACFNLNLLARDPAANVHARTFTQRLVYDALDFLDNNSMDFTALTSSRALNPAIYHGTNVNVRASDGTLATESMIWMSGTHFNDPGAIAGVGTLLKPMKLHP